MTDSAFSIGIEREGLRIDGSGRLAMTAHPAEFGDKLKSFRVSTDFGEAMMELRTEPQHDTAACYGELLHITKDVLKVLARRGEFLWPYSMPCAFPDDSAFPFNSYPDDPDAVPDLLSKQIISPVLWEKTIRNMIGTGIDTFIEIGPGKTLTNMIRKISREVTASNFEEYLSE